MTTPHSTAAHDLLTLIHERPRDFTADERFTIWAWRECEALGFVRILDNLTAELTPLGLEQIETEISELQRRAA